METDRTNSSSANWTDEKREEDESAHLWSTPHFTHSPVGAILSSRVFIGDRLSCYIAVLVAASTIGTRTLRIRLLGLLLAWVETIHIRPTELIQAYVTTAIAFVCR